MSSPFDQFTSTAARIRPQVCVVLGSGLGDVASDFHAESTVAYADVPGLVPPSIAGHKGQMSVGYWGNTPAIICFGRVHFYEGHPWARVVRLVNLVADLGVKTLVLTNAAGGIRSDLNPGDLMAIRGHLKLLETTAWKTWVERAEESNRKATPHPLLTPFGSTSPTRGEVEAGVGFSTSPLVGEVAAQRRVGGRFDVEVPNPYSPRLLARMAELDPNLPNGVYAALTGPTYETPAEIRALAHAGADAVGMSTAVEAEAGAARGMEIAAVSCITNKGAGLFAGTLSHREVELTAKLALSRLRSLLGGLIEFSASAVC